MHDDNGPTADSDRTRGRAELTSTMPPPKGSQEGSLSVRRALALGHWPHTGEPLAVARYSHADAGTDFLADWGMTAWSPDEDIVEIPQLGDVQLDMSPSGVTLVAFGVPWARTPRPPRWAPADRCFLAVIGPAAGRGDAVPADVSTALEAGSAFLGDVRVVDAFRPGAAGGDPS